MNGHSRASRHFGDVPQTDLSADGRLGPTDRRSTAVRLGKPRIDSILNELAAILARPDFFSALPTGINCASGFIGFGPDGVPHLKPHERAQKCRHVLPGTWHPDAPTEPRTGSLLQHLLSGIFCGDPDADEKALLLAEIAGAAALGYGTRLPKPQAVILKGEKAENGKSQILNIIRGLLPSDAVSSITAADMTDERHIVGLVGKLLNASDELSSATAIASDRFKAIVTGEPVAGREAYKARAEFRPVAQHLFATNMLPVFSGGIDRGVQRRLARICEPCGRG